MHEFGLNVKSASDRARFNEIIENTTKNPDQVVEGTFRGRGVCNARGSVNFHIKGSDVVVNNKNGGFVTVMRGGINEISVRMALGIMP